jgi:hypothetical protein
MAASKTKEDILTAAAAAVAVESGADVLVLNGPCFPSFEEQVLDVLRKRRNDLKRPKKLIFVLTTPGGLPDVAYRVGRGMHSTYEECTALVGGWCKSAGTMLLIGADSLALADEAELGPLDIQLAKRDELNEQDSGLVINEAMDNLELYAFRFFDAFMRQIKDKSQGLVTLKTASEIASTVACGLFEPIYRQIDPQKIGEVARSMAVGRAYGLRLNLRPRNLRPGALDSLLKGYPSHGFVIDREEAQRLFHKVRQPSSAEQALLLELGSLAIEPCRDPVVHFFPALEDSHENEPQEPPRPEATAPRVRRGRRGTST